MQAQSVLLEPWYAFRLELPAEQVGRAMADIQKMYGTFEAPVLEGERATLSGRAPASEMIDYPAQVQSYTGGRGRLALRLEGYFPCHDQEEVIEALDYDCEGDLDNPSGSIFCSHGAGFFCGHGMKCRITCISGKKCRRADSLTDDAGANVSLNKRNTSGADTFSEGNNGLPAGKNDAKKQRRLLCLFLYRRQRAGRDFFSESLEAKNSRKTDTGGYRKGVVRSEAEAPGRRRTTGAGTSAGRKGTTTSGVRSASRAETSKYSGNAGMLSGPQREKTVSAGGRLQYHLCLGFFKGAGGDQP